MVFELFRLGNSERNWDTNWMIFHRMACTSTLRSYSNETNNQHLSWITLIHHSHMANVGRFKSQRPFPKLGEPSFRALPCRVTENVRCPIVMFYTVSNDSKRSTNIKTQHTKDPLPLLVTNQACDWWQLNWCHIVVCESRLSTGTLLLARSEVSDSGGALYIMFENHVHSWPLLKTP